MYSIFLDDICIYDDTSVLSKFVLLNPRWIRQDNTAGSLTFTIAPSNPGYDILQPFENEIEIRKNGVPVWNGRPITTNINFAKLKSVTCEGCLGYLNDTIQPQHQYNSTSIQSFLNHIINNHNAQSTRKFALRNVIGDGSNHNFTTDYTKTWEAISNELIENIGGHILVEKVNNIYYIDYYYDYPNTSSQIIRFGTNLLDFTQDLDRTSICTVLIPLGASIDYDEETGFENRVNIKSVNGGKEYLEATDAIAEYGRIVKVMTWDYVEDPTQLKQIGERYLSVLQFEPVQLNINAVDMTMFGIDTEEFKMLDKVLVISDPHGLNKYFPITKIDMPLYDLSSTSYTMGAFSDVSLSQNNQAVQNYIYSVSKEYNKKMSDTYVVAKETANSTIVSDTLHYLATPLSEDVTINTPGWTTTPQSITETNKYLWTYHTYLYGDDHTSDTSPVITGVYGEDGSPGAQGPKGDKGDTGAQGAQGPKGDKGDTGNQGVQGPKGDKGDTGAQGPKGDKGDTGVSISSVTNYYLATNLSSGVTTKTSGWTTSIQNITSEKQYLWNYEVITGNNGQIINTSDPVIIGRYGRDGQTGSQGATGRGITSIKEYYQVSSSNTTAPTTWSDNPVNTTITNKYLWNYETITYTDGTSSNTEKRVIGTYGNTGAKGDKGDTGAQGAKGDKGDTGAQGPKGDKGTSVTVSSIQYASSTNGTTAPSSGWQNTIPTVAQGSYLWTKTTYSNGSIAYTNARQGSNGAKGAKGDKGDTGAQGAKGDKGDTGAQGPKGDKGTDGDDGISIVSVTPLWYCSNSSTAPSVPRSEVTTTSTNTGIWTKGVPALSSTYKYLYTCDQVKYSDGHFTWTTPVLHNTLTSVYSEIIQLADSLVLKINDNNQLTVVALGKAAGEGTDIRLQGKNIRLDGDVTITSGFKLNAGVIQSQNYVAGTSGTKINLTDGKLETMDGTFRGSITAYNGIKLYSQVTNSLFDFVEYKNTGDVSTSTFKINVLNKFGNVATLLYYTYGTHEVHLNGSADYATSAGSASSATSAGKASKLANYYSTRPTSANILIGDGSLTTFQATASMTTGKPNGEAHIMHLAWDNTGGWDSQLAVANNTKYNWKVAVRAQNSGTWSNWFYLLDSSGGNLTGWLTFNTNLGIRINNQSQVTNLGTSSVVLCGNSGGFVRRYDNNNTATVMHASQFAVDSSKLIKENIEDITDDYARNILKLRPVSFDYIEKVGGQKGQCGMIAEEVLPIYPECVNVPDGYTEEKAIEEIENGSNMMCLSLDYAKFTPYLIKMVQMQQKEIDELKSLIAKLS